MLLQLLWASEPWESLSLGGGGGGVSWGLQMLGMGKPWEEALTTDYWQQVTQHFP